MSSLSRKMKRKKEKKSRRAAEKKSKEISDKISKMPTSCAVCDKKFDRTDKLMIETWMISVYDNGESILTCDKCAA